jgi:hypothetical protein
VLWFSAASGAGIPGHAVNPSVGAWMRHPCRIQSGNACLTLRGAILINPGNRMGVIEPIPLSEPSLGYRCTRYWHRVSWQHLLAPSVSKGVGDLPPGPYAAWVRASVCKALPCAQTERPKPTRAGPLAARSSLQGRFTGRIHVPSPTGSLRLCYSSFLDRQTQPPPSDKSAEIRIDYPTAPVWLSLNTGWKTHGPINL